MCDRYTQLLTWEQIVQLYGLAAGVDPPAYFQPRYNVAPNQMAPVMRMRDGKRELAMLQWGLIPSSAKDRSMGDRLINARAESVANEPAFRSAFEARRCLVLTSGFYEWQGKTKQPFWIGMKDGGEFDMAGLWESWRDRTSGEVIESFTIITTAANALASQIHDRMSVIMDPNDFDTWLRAYQASRRISWQSATA